ncbi:MAG: hypothetical protein PVI92_16350, partial [Chromatiales bacterium]
MIKLLKWLLLAACLSGTPLTTTLAQEEAGALEQAAELLKSRKFSDKSQALDLLAQDAGEQAIKVLQALLKSRLYYVKKGKRLVVIEAKDKVGYRISDALSNEPMGSIGKRKIKKISLNNRLRSQIRGTLAVLDLRSSEPKKRLSAVNQMLAKPSAEYAELIEPMLEQETDGDVRQAMEIVIALGHLSADDKSLRKAAVDTLDGNIHPAVRIGL